MPSTLSSRFPDFFQEVFRGYNGRLNGFLLLGDVRCAGVLTALVKNRTEVSAQALSRDLTRGFSYRPRLYAIGGLIRA